MTNHVKSFIVGVSFMSVFGFIDNIVLLLGMGATQGYENSSRKSTKN
jgi:hypothetical protein